AVPGRAGAGHKVGVVAVPHPALVEDVGETVPLRHALERHDDPVVRAAVALCLPHLLRRARPVAAIAEHRVDRIEALSRSALRPLALPRNAERADLTPRRQATTLP